MSDCNRPVIPHKLPAKDRKKLSLLIDNTNSRQRSLIKDTTNNTNHKTLDDSADAYCYRELHNIEKYYEIQKSFCTENSQNSMMFNDTYMYFDEPYDTKQGPINHEEDTYFVLNDHYSKSSIQNVTDSSSSSVDQLDAEESDEENYYVPFALRQDTIDSYPKNQLEDNKVEELKTRPGSNESSLNYTDVVVSNQPKLPLKMSKKQFEQSIKKRTTIRTNSQTNSQTSCQDEYCSLSQNEFSQSNFNLFIDDQCSILRRILRISWYYYFKNNTVNPRNFLYTYYNQYY